MTVGNVPHLQDVTTMIELLGRMGVTVTIDERMRIEVDASTIKECFAPYELVKTMRASILVLGPLVARFGKADVSLPGGCAIGARPVNIHVAGLQAMGADITIEGGYIRARAGRLQGARLVLDTVTVTGTENLMMAATLADGETVIENAAREPEVVDLANFLIAMGAKIQGAGTDKIVIQGVERLHGTELRGAAGPHRERHLSRGRRDHAAATCASRTRGPIISMRCWRSSTRRARRSASATTGSRWTCAGAGRRRSTCAPRRIRRFRPTCRRSSRRSTPWPMAWAPIIETIFENRFMHMLEMRRLGAEIRLEGNTAIIHGVDEADRRAGDGHRPARVGEPGAGGAGRRRAAPTSSASITSIAATRRSRKSWRSSARRSDASRTESAA